MTTAVTLAYETTKRLHHGVTGALATITPLALAAAAAEASIYVTIGALTSAAAAGDRTVSIPLGVQLNPQIAVLVLLLLVTLRLALSSAAVVLSSRLSHNVLVAARSAVLLDLFERPWAEEARTPVGHSQDLLATSTVRTANAVHDLATICAAGASLLLLFAVGTAISPLALAAAPLALVTLSALRPLTRRTRAHSTTFGLQNRALTEMVADRVGAALEIRAYGLEAEAAADLQEVSQRAARALHKSRVTSALAPQLYLSAMLGCLVLGAGLLALGSASLATLGAISLITLRSAAYGQQLATATQSLSAGRPFVQALAPVLSNIASRPCRRDATALPNDGQLELRDVSFGYPDSPPIFESISLIVPHGAIVSIVGPSGVGKSTLAQLLLGLRQPTSGYVRLGSDRSIDVSRVAREALAFVPQDPAIVSGSIRENIRFYRDYSDTDIECSARGANIDLEIRSDLGGYDAPIGYRGRQVSGGQKQRIAIARALCSSPSLLILDEPTSALDAESLEAVRQTITRLRTRVTTFVITHDASLADVCDFTISLQPRADRASAPIIAMVERKTSAHESLSSATAERK